LVKTQKIQTKGKTHKNIFAVSALLTIISFLIKGEGMLFRSYLSARIGAEGMGLYQLIMSVYSLFAAFATSGFTVAISRLVSEKYTIYGEKEGASTGRRILGMGVCIALCVSIIASFILMVFSPFIAEHVLKDNRTAKPLFILGFSMVFMAVSACLKGYLLGTGQIYKPSLVSLFEQTVKITVIVFFFRTFLSGVQNLETFCIGIVTGLTLGEFSSFLLLVIMYYFGKRKEVYVLPAETKRQSIISVGKVTLPIAGSAYTSNLLHTVESILIPAMLELSMGSKSDALSVFGIIRGMAIPALFFPFSFLSAVVSVAIPEISGTKDKATRDEKIHRIMKTVTVYSIPAGSIFFFFSEDIARLLYGSAESADAIRILATVTPFMYIETVSDGLLKSIGEESRVFRYGLYNSALRLISILLFMRSTGEMGYIALLIISNTFSFLLCYGRLKRVSGMKLSLLGEFIFPALCTFGESFAISVLFGHLSSARWGIMKIVMSICLYVPVALWVLYSGKERKK
jgi:stage V sporulation protein B